MSWLGEGSLIDGGSKAVRNCPMINKDIDIWNQVKKRRMRSHRKTNKEMEEARIMRWTENADKWKKELLKNNELNKVKMIQEKKLT